MHKKIMLGAGVLSQLLWFGACGSNERQTETLGTAKLAIQPCDTSAPFNAPVRAFTGEYRYDGLTFKPNGLSAYLSGEHLSSTSYDIMRVDRTSLDAGFPDDASVVTSLSTSNVNDRGPQLSEDGNTIYLARPSPTYDDIYSAQWDASAGEFGQASALTAVNGTLHDRDPFYSAEEDDLYFSSERGGSDTRDLYQWDGSADGGVTKLPTGSGSVNLDGIDEERPVVSSDGLVLYFSSKRSGIGNDTNGDIFMSTRTSTGSSFGSPTNLVALNSSGRDFPVAISADKCTLWFASNEHTGLSGTDLYHLYEAKRPEEASSSVPLRIEIDGTGSVTDSPFNCSHTGPGVGGTGTCTANAAPNSTQVVNASSSSLWTGSCTGNNGNPSTDGVLVWADGGVCTIKIQ
jgi:hypothetical protein